MKYCQDCDYFHSDSAQACLKCGCREFLPTSREWRAANLPATEVSFANGYWIVSLIVAIFLPLIISIAVREIVPNLNNTSSMYPFVNAGFGSSSQTSSITGFLLSFLSDLTRPSNLLALTLTVGLVHYLLGLIGKRNALIMLLAVTAPVTPDSVLTLVRTDPRLAAATFIPIRLCCVRALTAPSEM